MSEPQKTPDSAPKSPDAGDVTKTTAVKEAVKTGMKFIPHFWDTVEILLDVLGYRSLSNRIKAITNKPQEGSTESPSGAPKSAVTAPNIPPAPFGLSGFSLNDEARMKRVWDGVLGSFQDMRPTADVPDPANVCFEFAKLSAKHLKTYERQERLRVVITTDPDDRKAVAGCRRMVIECGGEERYVAYMSQIGVLTAPTHGERARAAAAKHYRDRCSQIKQGEYARRRALGIDQ